MSYEVFKFFLGFCAAMFILVSGMGILWWITETKEDKKKRKQNIKDLKEKLKDSNEEAMKEYEERIVEVNEFWKSPKRYYRFVKSSFILTFMFITHLIVGAIGGYSDFRMKYADVYFEKDLKKRDVYFRKWSLKKRLDFFSPVLFFFFCVIFIVVNTLSS
jgi:hypothetical protein